MEVHRISENTIRVTMDADELKERGITMLDLLGNKSQIQHFFYQILSEVDTDHTFAKGDPVTFQVMPSSSGLELLISKVPDSDDDSSNNPNDQLRDLLKGLGAGVHHAVAADGPGHRQRLFRAAVPPEVSPHGRAADPVRGPRSRRADGAGLASDAPGLFRL